MLKFRADVPEGFSPPDRSLRIFLDELRSVAEGRGVREGEEIGDRAGEVGLELRAE
jgi:hypothetical protein